MECRVRHLGLTEYTDWNLSNKIGTTRFVGPVTLDLVSVLRILNMLSLVLGDLFGVKM